MGREDFDGHGTVEARIARTVHLAHATRSERRLDFVWTKFDTGSEGHQLCAQLYAKEIQRIGDNQKRPSTPRGVRLTLDLPLEAEQVLQKNQFMDANKKN
jgi:hypothetical protein